MASRQIATSARHLSPLNSRCAARNPRRSKTRATAAQTQRKERKKPAYLLRPHTRAVLEKASVRSSSLTERSIVCSRPIFSGSVTAHFYLIHCLTFFSSPCIDSCFQSYTIACLLLRSPTIVPRKFISRVRIQIVTRDAKYLQYPCAPSCNCNLG